MATIQIRVKPGTSAATKFQQDPHFRAAYIQQRLTELQQTAPGYIKDWIKANPTFTNRTGNAANKWLARVEGTTVHVGSPVPYVRYLNDGVRPHQMSYLLGAGPIFIPAIGWRTPSLASMQAGRWMHPGRQGGHFVEQALQKLVDDLAVKWPELVVTLKF